jgi:quercetin dioxygenase-like cupin family protein
MSLDVQPVPRPDWAPRLVEGCRGVEFKVLLERADLLVAMLRFGPDATIDEHAAPVDVDVICLEGHGMTSVDGMRAPLTAGEQVRWPAHAPHCLWTEDGAMVTLMIEDRRGH